MAFSKYIPLLAVLLLLLPMIAISEETIPPSVQTAYEKLCDEVNCGKGTCKVDLSKPPGFVCECEAGWKRTHDNDDDFTFLPCAIPNCTLDYGCQTASPPVPEKPVPQNMSFFDPCYWVYCGEGKCTKNSTYRHTCECNHGFSNLLDVPFYPCYSECTLGSHCAKLGIKVSNSTSDDNNGASSVLAGKFLWVAMVIISMTTFLWS